MSENKPTESDVITLGQIIKTMNKEEQHLTKLLAQGISQ